MRIATLHGEYFNFGIETFEKRYGNVSPLFDFDHMNIVKAVCNVL